MRNLELDDELVCRNARALAELAHDHLWVVRVTYAIQPDGKDNVAIRLRRFGVTAWAVWVDGRFTGAAISNPLSALNFRDLKTAITNPQENPRAQ